MYPRHWVEIPPYRTLIHNHAETMSPYPIRTASHICVVLEPVNEDNTDKQSATAMVGGMLHVTLAATAAGSASPTVMPHCTQISTTDGGPIQDPTASR
jgi:hypothetical protein